MGYERILTAPERSFFLFGPRGVGKSTWLAARFPNAVVVDLLDEALFQRYLADPGEFSLRMNALPNGSCVVIDEVQRLPQLLNEVHRFIEKRSFRFVLSGSSARKLRRAGTNLLAGRAIRREMYPLTPEELGQDFNVDRVLAYGSLPIIWMANGERDVMESYVQTYLREEIQAEALVRNLAGFARFLPVAALFHGQVINASSLARDAGVSRTTVLGYIEILEDTLLAFRLPAWEGKLRVKEKTHPKLYWIDPGIARAARRRFGPVVDEERGALFEGWIASLLKAYQSYRQCFDDWNYWAPTETDNLEVDFLLWKNDRCLALEVKSSTRWRGDHGQGLRAVAKSWKDTRTLVCKAVYLGDALLRTDDGIEVLPIKTFLDRLENGTLFADFLELPHLPIER
jgi:predicted AAA+ superfamily ATPase